MAVCATCQINSFSVWISYYTLSDVQFWGRLEHWAALCWVWGKIWGFCPLFWDCPRFLFLKKLPPPWVFGQKWLWVFPVGQKLSFFSLFSFSKNVKEKPGRPRWQNIFIDGLLRLLRIRYFDWYKKLELTYFHRQCYIDFIILPYYQKRTTKKPTLRFLQITFVWDPCYS